MLVPVSIGATNSMSSMPMAVRHDAGIYLIRINDAKASNDNNGEMINKLSKENHSLQNEINESYNKLEENTDKLEELKESLS